MSLHEITMIRGMHGLLYSSEPEAARAFIRDKLGLPHTDIGEGWLIFDLPEGDLGVHPTGTKDASIAGTHDISFYCDDIEGTVAQLKSRGVEFTDDVTDAGYGLITYFKIPGGVRVQLYEPKYKKQQNRSKRRSSSTPKSVSRTDKPQRSTKTQRRR